MDGHLLVPFILATFLGGFVSGFSGFAMGIVVSGIWLHIITPIQVAALIAGYGLLTQGYGIAKLRHELSWRSIWPPSHAFRRPSPTRPRARRCNGILSSEPMTKSSLTTRLLSENTSESGTLHVFVKFVIDLDDGEGEHLPNRLDPVHELAGIEAAL